MLNNILNHEGAIALDKKQQESILGGQTCHVRIDGGAGAIRYIQQNVGSGQDACNSAGEHYTSQPGGNGNYRCRYDCDGDGAFTASWWALEFEAL